MDLNRHTSSEACVGLGGARWWWDVIGVDWSHRWAMVTEEFHMVESEGKSYSGSESEASDSESEELALASEEGAESPYFSDANARCVWWSVFHFMDLICC